MKDSEARLVLCCKDSEVSRLCRELIEQLRDKGVRLIEDSSGAAVRSGDVCVREYVPGTESVNRGSCEARDLFVVDRKDLEAFERRTHRSVEANVLLKPVSRGALWAFLESMFRSRTPEGASEVETLRAERDEILQCLIQTNVKLQQYEHERTAFLARTFHEFRAPLTALTGYFGLLLDSQMGPLTESQTLALRRMQRCADRLSRMSEGMFRLSIDNKTKNRVSFEKGDIAACVEHAVHEIEPACHRKQITVDVDLRPTDGPLYFEEAQIEQVLVNLLDNASRFAPRNGAIRISGRPYFWERRVMESSRRDESVERRGFNSSRPNSYRVDVSDNGPGIRPEMVDQIFEEYVTYEDSDARSGGGLGLAICKVFLNHHRGRIWAVPNAAGALFSFVLPIGNPTEARRENSVFLGSRTSVSQGIEL